MNEDYEVLYDDGSYGIQCIGGTFYVYKKRRYRKLFSGEMIEDYLCHSAWVVKNGMYCQRDGLGRFTGSKAASFEEIIKIEEAEEAEEDLK